METMSLEQVDKQIIEISQRCADLSRQKESCEKKLKELLRQRNEIEKQKEIEEHGEPPAMKKIYMTFGTLKSGILITELFHGAELVISRSDARRTIQQGRAFINGKKHQSIDTIINEKHLVNNELMLCVDDKYYVKIVVNDDYAKTKERKSKQIRIAELQQREVELSLVISDLSVEEDKRKEAQIEMKTVLAERHKLEDELNESYE